MTAHPRLLIARDRRDDSSRDALLRRVRAEFEEMPCLRLTAAQAQRLLGLKPDVCQRVLSGLVRDKTLTRGADERYKLGNDSAWPTLSTLARHLVPSEAKAS